MLPTRRHGTIVRIMSAKGFLFIRLPDGADIFAHATCCTELGVFDDRLCEVAVTFDVQPDPGHQGRLRAINVKRV